MDLKLLVVLTEDGVHLWLIYVADILAAVDSIESDNFVTCPTAIYYYREGVSTNLHNASKHLDHLRALRLPHPFIAHAESGLATASQTLNPQGCQSHNVETSAVYPSSVAGEVDGQQELTSL